MYFLWTQSTSTLYKHKIEENNQKCFHSKGICYQINWRWCGRLPPKVCRHGWWKSRTGGKELVPGSQLNLLFRVSTGFLTKLGLFGPQEQPFCLPERRWTVAILVCLPIWSACGWWDQPLSSWPGQGLGASSLSQPSHSDMSHSQNPGGTQRESSRGQMNEHSPPPWHKYSPKLWVGGIPVIEEGDSTSELDRGTGLKLLSPNKKLTSTGI